MATAVLNASQLYRHADLSLLEDCKTTRDLAPLDDIIGQQRAQSAVEFAMSIRDKGYNIFAIGRSGLGKRTMMLRYLKRHPQQQTLSDWCYVANFDEPRTPQVLALPAGSGAQFKKEVEKTVLRLVKALPLAFDNEVYYRRADKLKTQLAQRQEATLAELATEAKEKHVRLTINPDGDYQLTALNGEEPHTEESYAALPESERQQFDDSIRHLESRLRGIVRQLTEWEEEFSTKQQQHDEQVAREVLGHFFKPLKDEYRTIAEVRNFLSAMQKDMLRNLDIFLEQSEDQLGLAYASLEKKMPRRYQVNLLVTQDSQAAQFPVVVEENPTYHGLFGYVENATFRGTVFTDFSLIRAGSLHHANGGVLLMDAIKVLERPYVWDGLKRALRSRTLDLNSLERQVSLSGTVSLEPQPIALDVKIVLFGDYQTYQLLQYYDPDFCELFRVTADFEDTMPRSAQVEGSYARFIASIVHDNQLLPCDNSAIARIIEYSSRQADDQTLLSLHSANVANLLRESHYCAKSANARTIRAIHVEQALNQQEQRVSKLRDQLMQGFSNGTNLLNVKGSAVGQINALSVIATSDHQFGMPNRITASTSFGKGEVLDIEHKARLGGKIHSKGVWILSAFINNLLGKTQAIPLTISLTFEQSYSSVDGDSASMAECCAILSAISNMPIRQDIAITGSMNQFGEAQPIGGVNEKIEGFFDVCQLKGRKHTQGVIIPASNVNNLMLKKAVVDAVAKGKFHIWSVEHVSDALSILCDMEAGHADKRGHFPLHSVLGTAAANLAILRDNDKG
ncbi:Lon protease family protein [Shewanella sp. YIC-542]|uniref:Lon protease family protein n=1 Tax=Shewanella mytili TaxID=3377111 RepID=UPI00398EB48F